MYPNLYPTKLQNDATKKGTKKILPKDTTKKESAPKNCTQKMVSKNGTQIGRRI